MNNSMKFLVKKSDDSKRLDIFLSEKMVWRVPNETMLVEPFCDAIAWRRGPSSVESTNGRGHINPDYLLKKGENEVKNERTKK